MVLIILLSYVLIFFASYLFKQKSEEVSLRLTRRIVEQTIDIVYTDNLLYALRDSFTRLDFHEDIQTCELVSNKYPCWIRTVQMYNRVKKNAINHELLFSRKKNGDGVLEWKIALLYGFNNNSILIRIDISLDKLRTEHICENSYIDIFPEELLLEKEYDGCFYPLLS